MMQRHNSKHNHADRGEHESAHEHDGGMAEYVRLAVMAAVIVADLSGWWRNWMSRDWVAFAATLIGGFPIFEEAWENLRKRRMRMEHISGGSNITKPLSKNKKGRMFLPSGRFIIDCRSLHLAADGYADWFAPLADALVAHAVDGAVSPFGRSRGERRGVHVVGRRIVGE